MFRARSFLLVLLMSFVATPAGSDWLPGGNPLCTVPGYQGDLGVLTLTGDGPFQALFAFWSDARDTVPAGSDLYGCSVSLFGPDENQTDGLPLVTAPGFQGYADAGVTGHFGGQPSINDGAIVVGWADNRNGALDVYAREVFAVAAPWPSGGVPVCTAPGAQHEVRVAGDPDRRCANLAWFDQRNAFNAVYAQRLDRNGAPQWAADGVAVCDVAATRLMLRVAPAPDGGVFIAWLDARSGPMKAFAMRVDSDGLPAPGWTADGVQASSLPLGELGPLTPDGAGGVFLVGHTSSGHPLVCRLDGDSGVHAGWPADGAFLTGSAIEGGLQDAIPFGDGLVVAFVRDIDPDLKTMEFDLYVQRILGDGSRPAGWGADGNVLCNALGDQGNAQLAEGPAIVGVWEDGRPGSIGEDLYAMRLLEDGDPDPAWPANGVVIASGNGRQFSPRPVWDGFNRVMVAYLDDHDFNSFETDVYVQNVSLSGNVANNVGVSIPEGGGFELSEVHPNPARSQVSAILTLSGAASVRAEILDVLGRRVRVLDSGGAISRTLRWDLADESGRRVEPGIYFIRAWTATESRMRTLVVRR